MVNVISVLSSKPLHFYFNYYQFSFFVIGSFDSFKIFSLIVLSYQMKKKDFFQDRRNKKCLKYKLIFIFLIILIRAFNIEKV